MLRVLHLTGSAESDFYCDLSRLYAQDCLAATADPTRYQIHIAYVTPDAQWRFPNNLSREDIAAAEPVSFGQAVQRIQTLKPHIMVPQMFCIPGMTYYRALFDLLGIPYLGNTPDIMALTAHKARARAVVASAGVPVPPAELLRRGDAPTLPPPTVVKPVTTDNSLGISFVREAAQYPTLLQEAFGYSDEVLVETFIELGREVRCGIIVRDGELVCLPLEEYALDNQKPIRGYEDKISQTQSGDLKLEAKTKAKAWLLDVNDPLTERVWEVAKRCHLALGCRHYSLFDFRVDPQGEVWFLEAGLYCSFAKQSVISMMANAAGIGLKTLFELSLDNAL